LVSHAEQILSRLYFAPLQRVLPAIAATALALPNAAHASPEVPLDDPVYLRIHELEDRGLIPVAATAAIRPLTQAEVRSLLLGAGQSPDVWLLDPSERGFWIKPAARLSSRLSLAQDAPRSFSTAVRPRSIAGTIQLGCEHQEGRPCGDGAVGMLELDSSTGIGAWASAFSRLRTSASSRDGSQVIEIDRLYTNFELGPAELTIGRNVLVIGPGRHTQLVWGTQAPPLDRISLAVRRLKVPHIPVALGAGYTLGRLDSPQRFPNTLVSIARVHLEIADRLNLGMTNLLQLGGAGAPSVGPWQFVEEHVHRTGPWPGEGVSNRRLGYDVTLQIRPLRSTFYFEFAFEDWRAQFSSALAYDTDYLVGWSSSGLGRAGRYGFVLELHRNGVRSQEHGVFAKGMTSGGRTVGSPLGPDAVSLFINPHWRVRDTLTLSPWLEVIRLGSDTFNFPEESAITRASPGVPELRWRAGVGALAALRDDLWLDAGSFFEHVRNDEFRSATRNNAGVSLAISWRHR
jgi:hypothetical protein